MVTAAVSPSPYVREQKFFSFMALGLATFILFAFAQWSARGMVDYRTEPLWPYAHGFIYLSWLAVIVTQTQLAEHRSFALHRRLGWASVAVAAAMVTSGWLVTVWDIQTHRQPPFFSPPYFLALSVFDITGFGVLIAAAIVKRRQVQWHSRLMLGATILLLEPAFGRLIPPSFFATPLPWDWLGNVGNLCQRLGQFGALSIMMTYDWRNCGTVHPAYIWTTVVLLGGYQIMILAARIPAVIAYATQMAGG
jgi:uncharacterized membrane protein